MATLVRWEPVREMMDLRRRMDRLFEDTMRSYDPEGASESAAWGVALDVAEDDQEYKVEASVPGVNPDDINITMHDSMLTISGESKREEEKEEGQWHLRERRYGRFSRTLRLPSPVEEEKIDANYENGVLTIHLPKSEETKPKRISVKPSKS